MIAPSVLNILSPIRPLECLLEAKIWLSKTWFSLFWQPWPLTFHPQKEMTSRVLSLKKYMYTSYKISYFGIYLGKNLWQMVKLCVIRLIVISINFLLFNGSDHHHLTQFYTMYIDIAAKWLHANWEALNKIDSKKSCLYTTHLWLKIISMQCTRD